MKRSAVGLAEVADWHNLAAAVRRAARGKGRRDEVRCFQAALPNELAQLRADILDGSVMVGRTRAFQIRDPKPRIIHAPVFRERVLHHALIAEMGPVLDRGLIDDSFACRVGKGALAAVRRAQRHAERFPCYAQIDIRACFASIDHAVLRRLLARRFKDAALLALVGRIIDAHHAAPGKGLPIGALTSQHFANYYLNGLDRLLLERCRVRGMVRYMDDLVWWGDDRTAVRRALTEARAYALGELGLTVKDTARVGRSRDGLTLCGYRILPGRLLLSRRRKRRYAVARRHWEAAFAAGRIDANGLQAGYAAVLAITAHADAAAWRREQLRRHPLADALRHL
ncbi:RNA-directed DNA polymerase [Azospirillum sp.]|uniref:RNA-directed DNA polymerase n=1 Tax=Azospirillum sp. TaxID=34012 RepID=UPI00260C9DB3|nr:RNA-directed DNA polymerase [Azospirillum sp.]